MTPPDLPGDPSALVGTWQLSRVIEDHLVGGVSHVDGFLDLTQETADLVLWQEQGTWRRTDGDMAVSRELRVERADDGWWVRFEDGRDFHPWRPGAQVVHDCAPDTYRGHLTGTAERWSIVWEATGPRKDYRMTTTLVPR
jgi:hypothetical protein